MPLKFETIWKKTKDYMISKNCESPYLIDHRAFWLNKTEEIDRFFYLAFKRECAYNFGFESDANIWVFDQNALKTKHNGKQSLKALCRNVYFDLESDFLNQN